MVKGNLPMLKRFSQSLLASLGGRGGYTRRKYCLILLSAETDSHLTRWENTIKHLTPFLSHVSWCRALHSHWIWTPCKPTKQHYFFYHCCCTGHWLGSKASSQVSRFTQLSYSWCPEIQRENILIISLNPQTSERKQLRTILSPLCGLDKNRSLTNTGI